MGNKQKILWENQIPSAGAEGISQLLPAVFLSLPKIVSGRREPMPVKRGDDGLDFMKALRVIQAVVV